ncbi:hypothetical protein D3C72_1303020 [compost metagenome]
MVRPRPVPPKRRVVDVSAWAKAEKIASCTSGAMPMPVSRTLKHSTAASPSRLSRALVSSTVPCVVNLMALLVRLTSTCSSRSASPITWSTPSGSGPMRTSIGLSCAATPMLAAILSITSARRNGACSMVMWPASIFDTSSTSLMMPSRDWPAARILRAICSASPSRPSRSSSQAMPRMALSGERISWLMLARNSALLRLAASAASRASSMASSACFCAQISWAKIRVAGPSLSSTRVVVLNMGMERPCLPRPRASNTCSLGESASISASLAASAASDGGEIMADQGRPFRLSSIV